MSANSIQQPQSSRFSSDLWCPYPRSLHITATHHKDVEGLRVPKIVRQTMTTMYIYIYTQYIFFAEQHIYIIPATTTMGPQEDHVDPQNWGDDKQLFPLRLQTIDTYILNQGLTRYSQTSSFNHERCAFRKTY